MIVRDRLCWLRESLDSDYDPLACRESGSVEGGGGETEGDQPRAEQISSRDSNSRWDVRLVGLFDQALGSARNLGIVVVPCVGSA